MKYLNPYIVKFFRVRHFFGGKEALIQSLSDFVKHNDVRQGKR